MWNLYVKIKFQEQLPFLFLQVYLDNKLPSLKTIDQNYSNVTVSFRVQVNHFEFDFQGVLNKNCWIKWYCDLMKVWQYLDSSFFGFTQDNNVNHIQVLQKDFETTCYSSMTWLEAYSWLLSEQSLFICKDNAWLESKTWLQDLQLQSCFLSLLLIETILLGGVSETPPLFPVSFFQ